MTFQFTGTGNKFNLIIRMTVSRSLISPYLSEEEASDEAPKPEGVGVEEDEDPHP